MYLVYANMDQDKAKPVRYVTFHNNEEISEPIIETSSVPLTDKEKTNTRRNWFRWKQT